MPHTRRTSKAKKNKEINGIMHVCSNGIRYQVIIRKGMIIQAMNNEHKGIGASAIPLIDRIVLDKHFLCNPNKIRRFGIRRANY